MIATNKQSRYNEQHNETRGRRNENQHVIELVERQFSELIRSAAGRKRFGQFGIVVSMQSGSIKTFQQHAVETVKPPGSCDK